MYKLSEEFAKLYFHKYWTAIQYVTTIWKRNVCSFIVPLNAFDVRPTCDTVDVQAILLFPPNGGMCISVQYLRKYGFAKFSDNLYAPCILIIIKIDKFQKIEEELWRGTHKKGHNETFCTYMLTFVTLGLYPLTLIVLMWRIGWAHNNARK